jgi:hypothetical protein
MKSSLQHSLKCNYALDDLRKRQAGDDLFARRHWNNFLWPLIVTSSVNTAPHLGLAILDAESTGRISDGTVIAIASSEFPPGTHHRKQTPCRGAAIGSALSYAGERGCWFAFRVGNRGSGAPA